MLIHWQSHQEYLNFLHETNVNLDSSQRTRLIPAFISIREKLRMLNLVVAPVSIPMPPYGHKVLSHSKSDISDSFGKRHFSDPDARWRWDSVRAIVSLREPKTIHPDISVRNICLGSVHDNYCCLRALKGVGHPPFY